MSSPETGFGGGAMLGWYEGGGAGARPSSALVDVIITTKGQVIAELIPELYVASDRVKLSGELRALRFPDTFHGIGNRATGPAAEAYTARTFAAEADLLWEARPAIWLGGRLARLTRSLATRRPARPAPRAVRAGL